MMKGEGFSMRVTCGEPLEQIGTTRSIIIAACRLRRAGAYARLFLESGADLPRSGASPPTPLPARFAKARARTMSPKRCFAKGRGQKTAGNPEAEIRPVRNRAAWRWWRRLAGALATALLIQACTRAPVGAGLSATVVVATSGSTQQAADRATPAV